MLAFQQKTSTPVHEEKKLWITYIAIYLYEVGGHPTPRMTFHLMLLFFQSSGLCVQSPSIIPVPGYPLCLVPHLRSLDDRFSYPVV